MQVRFGGSCSLTVLTLTMLFTALFTPSPTQAAPPAELVRLSELIHASNYAEAHAYAVDLLKEKPDDVVLLRVKGVCEMELGKPTEAVRTFRHALTVDPDSVSCRYYLAQAHAYRGSTRESIRLLEEVVARAPDSAFGQKAKAILPELENMAETTSAIPDQKRWSIYASVSMDQDDNVPARADGDPNLLLRYRSNLNSHRSIIGLL